MAINLWAVSQSSAQGVLAYRTGSVSEAAGWHVVIHSHDLAWRDSYCTQCYLATDCNSQLVFLS